MIVTPSEMKISEEHAFASGSSAESLMEEAGVQVAAVVQQFFPDPGRCIAFSGKGHNGGDALVAARHLVTLGWNVELRPAFAKDEWSELTRRKHDEYNEIAAEHCNESGRHPKFRQSATFPLVVLDGLVGIGASGELRGPVRDGARAINRLRAQESGCVFAIDLPTGVDGETGEPAADAVLADFTLAIGFAKAGLLTDASTPYVGRLAVLPLRALALPATLPNHGASCASSAALAPLLPRRRFDVHKGDFGRIGIVAGSRGLCGAAIMAAEAAVRAGAGLVSLYVTEEIYPVVAAATSPEVMVRPVQTYVDVLEVHRDVLALGPGLGESRRTEVLELIRRAKVPMVIDADGLNVLAAEMGALDECAGPRLLTPHPGEMARLDAGARDRSRRATVETFTARWPHTLLFKGARTIVGQRGRPLSYNSTGSPGMASGGMGDVLTGVCAALAGQGLGLYDAARAGAWLCGRAAELAIFRGTDSEESLCATSVLQQLGGAFKELRAGCY